MATNQNVLQLTQQTGSADLTSVLYAVQGGVTDTGLPLSVFVHNLGLTGTPTTPTAAVDTNTIQIASTAYVINQGYLKSATAATTYAPLASPNFTGTIGGGAASINLGGTASFASIQSTPIGSTAASTGKFTTLQATGAFTPASTVGIVGTITNDNANAGSIGEYVTATGTTVSITTGTTTNIISMSLGAGDWEVWGNIEYDPAGSTVFTQAVSAINTTSTTFPSAPFKSIGNFPSASGNIQTQVIVPQRLSLPTTTTVYLIGFAVFTTSTLTATGILSARRRR